MPSKRHTLSVLVSKQGIADMEITKRKLLNCQEEMKRKRDDMFGPPVTGDLLARLEEQKALIKKLTEEVFFLTFQDLFDSVFVPEKFLQP